MTGGPARVRGAAPVPGPASWWGVEPGLDGPVVIRAR